MSLYFQTNLEVFRDTFLDKRFGDLELRMVVACSFRFPLLHCRISILSNSTVSTTFFPGIFCRRGNGLDSAYAIYLIYVIYFPAKYVAALHLV